jgi:molybdopterin synthase catalytic subunit
MPARVIEGAFKPATELAAFEAMQVAGSVGATASFIGTMRNHNEGDAVVGMTLEHYPAMTQRELDHIISDAHERWPLIDALIVHRVGDIKPGEAIVLTAVCSAHRAAAFDACRYLMEELKSRAPFWKKEALADGGSRWVEKNTPG